MVFPIDDKNKPHHRTWFYLTIIVAFLLIHALISVPGDETFRRITETYGLVPRRLFEAQWAEAQGFAPGGWFTLLTSNFLHSGSFHVIVNLWLLFIFADNVEDRMGPMRFAAFFALCGLAGTTTHAVLCNTSTVPVACASGAVAGVMGAYTVMYPGARVTFLPPFILIWKYHEIIALPAGLVLPLAFLAHLGILLLEPDIVNGMGVAWWANIGGFAFGAATRKLFFCEVRMKAAGELEAESFD